jgi:DNA replication and repair protein RecF
MEVQKYASQGQHKTYLVALKIAEFRYVRQRREEAPLFLLDDVFSELDADRCRRILELGSALGQVLLTTTEESSLRGAVSWNADNRKFLIEQGTARPA